MQTISVCGTGYSGSGAVLDLLNGYSNCHDICGKLEFFFPYFPDGIDDLTYHITEGSSRFHSSDVAIIRFKKVMRFLGKEGWDVKTGNQLQKLTSDFLENIVQLKWNGNWLFDLMQIHESKFTYFLYRLRRKCNSVLQKQGKHGIEVIPRRPMYLSTENDDCLSLVKQYIRDIIHSVYSEDTEGGLLLLNQSVPANNIEKFQKYFDDNKVIVVLRDPRDVYLNLKKVNDQNALWFPHDQVDDFITYYKILMNGVKREAGAENVMVLSFEDLIYKTEETVLKIVSFVGNAGKFDENSCHFDPGKSIQNTQLFRSFTEYMGDIKKIEKELHDYLYTFPEDMNNIQHTAMF